MKHKVLKFLAVAVASSVSFSAYSAEEKAQEPQKVDVKNLEKRYWAPKDRNFKVVQNRTYTKTKKFYVSVMPSFMLNEEYSKGVGIDFSLGYFFNDRWGLEFEYQSISLDDNDIINQIDDLGNNGAYANHGKATGYYGATLNWMPLYAKMSFLGRKIVYFDLSFGLSLGNIDYEQQFRDGIGERGQSAIAYGFHISQSFYLSKKFLIRADYKQRFYTEDIINGGVTSVNSGARGSDLGSRSEDSISLSVGLTYIL